MSEIGEKIRAEFPLLKNRSTVYLDSAATSQRPKCVLDVERHFYEDHNANPMRGLYDISIEATEEYEAARRTVAELVHAPRAEDIVFTRNATESLNLVAYSYGMNFLRTDDEIVVSIMEHHSNLLPWQQVSKHTGAKLVFFECDEEGYLDPEKLKALVNERTKMVCITQVSNLFGRVNDIKAFTEIAHSVGAIFVCDGAQSVPHIPVDVQELDVDFLAFSGHKMYGPMGIGALYGRTELLEKMPPFLYGGEMIEYVTRCGATYAEVPHKFEAGTVNAAGAAGMAEGIRFIQRYGFSAIEEIERELTVFAYERMMEIPHVEVLGSRDPAEHHGILTFVIEGVHPHDVATIFDAHGIAVRAGHHCVQPLHKHLHRMSTTRASMACYNNHADIDSFIDCLSGIRAEMGFAD